MKFKLSSDNKKPWEKISLDEIQPYPSKYNKLIITAYLFAFSVLFIKFLDLNSFLDPFIPFVKLIVYGIFAFIILKMVLKQTNESILVNLLFILPLYTLFVIIIFIIPVLVAFLVVGISLSSILAFFDFSNVLYTITFYFNLLFSLICWLTSYYVLIFSEHPKIKIHGYVLIVLMIFYFI